MSNGWATAGEALKNELQRHEALKRQLHCGWSVAEAIGDYVTGTGAAVSKALAGLIRSELDRVIQASAKRRNMAPAAVWDELRPLWQTWCNDAEAPTYGPQVFARNPRKWAPSSRATLGAYFPEEPSPNWTTADYRPPEE